MVCVCVCVCVTKQLREWRAEEKEEEEEEEEEELKDDTSELDKALSLNRRGGNGRMGKQQQHQLPAKAIGNAEERKERKDQIVASGLKLSGSRQGWRQGKQRRRRRRP